MQFLRAFLCLLGMFFAFALARVATRLYRQRLPLTKSLTWVLRTAVAGVAVLWTGGFDAIGVACMALIAIGFALGVYVELRPKHTEEIHLFNEKE